MADREHEYFRARPGPPRDHGAAQAPRFISRVLKASSKAGRRIGRTLAPAHARAGAAFGRGGFAARMNGGGLGSRSRRAIVKTRLVVLKRAATRSTQQHLRYIERDGVTREGGRGRLYGPDNDHADGDSFEQRGRGDRHQFRFIVSPEDGVEIGDLKTFTRDYMAQMARDLGTRLDWVAVDHWDTDDPHTHIVLRGKDDRGADLVIARDYIRHGMRQRASELATQRLGPRSQRDITRALDREVRQDRWTSLDRTLQRHARDGQLDLRHVPHAAADKAHRARLLGRLDHLARLGLAQRRAAGVWQLARDAEQTLRTMAERGDVIRTMQRALGQASRECVVADPRQASTPLSGRIAAKGLHDELREIGYLIIDGNDGRAHYLALPPSVSLADLPVGGLIEVRTGCLRVREHERAQVSEHRLWRGRGRARTAPRPPLTGSGTDRQGSRRMPRHG